MSLRNVATHTRGGHYHPRSAVRATRLNRYTRYIGGAQHGYHITFAVDLLSLRSLTGIERAAAVAFTALRNALERRRMNNNRKFFSL